MTRASWPNYAGLRHWARARSTGTQVAIYQGEEAGLDTEGGAYSIVCETHGCVIAVDTLRMARQHITQPEEWCDVEGGCIEQGRRAQGKCAKRLKVPGGICSHEPGHEGQCCPC